MTDARMQRIPTGIATRAIGTELLLRRLYALKTLNPDEVELVASLDSKPRRHEPGTAICPKSDGSPHPRLITSGWACRPRITADGRRQMLGILLPGDLIGDRGEARPLTTSPAVALTPVRTVSVAKLFDALAATPQNYPNLVAALNKMDLIEEARLLDLVVRLGCHTAIQRVAGSLLEFYQRSSFIGFTHEGTFPMPLTQEKLSDLLGLSLVHVNRVISQLRREKLVEIRCGIVAIHDFARLSLLADRADPSRPN
ncbi:Crp/Fnr family transcriptional regulator [Sphingomonas sp. PL-96]|uniref:Crp/Fnr family transcriptional regulator n=1 Tax=Sphingomonas sp. PL-96 TaxID=2887201 RepID=UPI001E433B36|nr:Crp/Fnr family transcriptional regulator [Sphingomonas sp. PL-96]MCC2976596.1 Crp/Fnr family transcriptional regulator [Sphingomonas sp. PL-96]